ncbi:hypothetical protein LOTGIDRAFT_236321 [Lottia gigantea]|uniref:Uncharacterized protein n=1 Tax=Lottia gigantea TaxID=225164 RepID=V3ZJG3_LOTGI|nr:hypothetical protein LOTGIDRAFT_236321 [Lottia gigantea]ESO84367.1 hypothetical protein LOTGIDRAFT_236321 [Lottia gigantea]
MANIKLVSAGDDIKVWDSRNFGLLKTFDPHDQNTSCVCWSHCGTFLTSCSENDDKIAVTQLKNTSFPTYEINVEKGNLCVDFNSNSRYILYGGTSCLVNVWDLKTKKMKKSFKEHKSAVTSVAFNWNDAYIASGSKSGEIILHNLITGQSGAPLKAPKVQAIKQLQYHFFHKALFAAASDDGAVNLWDANTRQLKHAFKDVHKAPATGLAFSPINEMLLLSVGLDKRIALYDVQGKGNLRVLMAESPLSCIDVMADGGTLAVGTTRGKILVYDIRQGPNPVQMFMAHSGPISTLSFHPKSAASDSGKSAANKKRPPETQKMKPDNPPADPNISNQALQIVKDKTQIKQNAVNTEDVFSPIRENMGVQGSTSFNDDSLFQNSTNSAGAGAFGVFSPLQGNGTTSSLPGKYSLGNSPLVNNSYQGASSAVISPVNGSSNYSVQSYHSDPSITSYNGMIQQRGVSASPSLPQIHVHETNNTAQPHVSLNTSPNSHAASTTGGKKVMFTDQSFVAASPSNQQINDCRQDLRQEIREAWQESKSSPQKPHTSPVSDPGLFQTEFIRNLVRESQEELREEIHRDLQSLHIEMLRQFQMQQAEVMSMMEHLSLNRDLVKEVEMLREENKRLKKQF